MMRQLGILVVTLLLAGAGLAQTGKTLVVKPSAGPLAGRTVYTNSHALLIGIRKYAHLPAEKQLDFADKDAAALRDLLVRSYGFRAENITLLLNEQATKSAIEEALAALADRRRVAEQDRVLLYFSGHGQTVKLAAANGEMGFLVPYDANVDLAQPDNAGPYLRTCLKMSTLRDDLAACPAKHALVVADACFSGHLAKGKDLKDAEEALASEVLAELAATPARQVITAGKRGQEAKEIAKLGHGAFTFKLLERLRAVAANEGRVVTARELHAGLQRTVGSLTNGGQTPQFGDYDTEGEFLFVATAPQEGGKSASERATELAREAEDLLYHGTYKDPRVLALAHEALQLQPEHPLAQAVLGYSLFLAADLEGAEREVRSALHADGKLPLAHFGAGNVYLAQNKLPEAEQALRQCLQLAPRFAPGHFGQGTLFHLRKQLATAERAYKKAIELDAKYAAPHIHLGILYSDQGQYVAAEQACKQAIRLDPYNAIPHNNLGEVYHDQMEYVAAEQAYNRAIQLDPQFAAPHNGLGNLYFSQARYREAEQAYKRAVQLDPKDSSPYYNLGRFYLLRLAYPEAEQAYKQAVRLDPKDAGARAGLGNVYYAQKQYDAAIREYERALQLDPNHELALENLENARKAKAGDS